MRPETANILALIDTYTLPSADDTSMKMAEDFRNRRIEKGITREEIAKMAGIATSNVARFEQKGLISLKNNTNQHCEISGEWPLATFLTGHKVAGGGLGVPSL